MTDLTPEELAAGIARHEARIPRIPSIMARLEAERVERTARAGRTVELVESAGAFFLDVRNPDGSIRESMAFTSPTRAERELCRQRLICVAVNAQQ